ncbi:MAG: uracil-DNA glycosylase [Syntrophothermus sp.]|uniref:uracil-DNA glycosylase n=1 Tax=Syntrophothermus sp. TaxID=2736299 RepID=UPI00257F41E9|nr:uracil-DNA glycosylase [Syntrophothermus sp.]NSW82340.1 uracil-DNA glycosylase [Syntrophothermus sp.]
MSGEELTLFPEIEPVRPEWGQDHYFAFLPGVKREESFLEISSQEELAARAGACSRCRLRSGCRQVVFGEGDQKADLMLVGEGPGQVEDEQGRPFVGPAGQLLDRILEACAIRRDEVYITNIVKCRPPGNRLPNPDEVAACRGWLEAQIRLMSPRIIVCLGLLATRTVIEAKATMAGIHGQWFKRGDVWMMAVYHPAALLRDPRLKRPAWEDFKLIRDKYQQLKRGELG